jgi:hypothetical protein
MTKVLSKTERLTDEVRHLVAEIGDAQVTIQTQGGQLRDRAARELRELSETLASKLSAARYFQYDDSLFLKFLDAEHVQVLMVTCWASVEKFDQVWMDTIARCEIISEAEYLEALETVGQEGGQPA